MKYIDEYRNADAAKQLAAAIARVTTRPWNIMEVCGGQTHAILRFGLDEMLPPEITLIHGPGCPVCVTPMEIIDRALAIAARPEVIFCSFGDMLRVPGSTKDLFTVKSEGGDVRIVYSPMDAVSLAQKNLDRQVVFFGVGFETTAPANAMAVVQAARLGLANFSVLVSHVLVPPAMCAVLSSPTNRVQGFLAAGHVCTIMGTGQYEPIAEKYHVPIVVTGFEPLDILQGVLMCVEQLEEGRAEVENQYSRAVRPRAIGPRWKSCRMSSRSCRESGAGSARYPTAAGRSARPTHGSTPIAASTSPTSRPRSPPSASPGWFCRVRRSRTSVRPSVRAARRIIRWARRWCRRKGPVRPIIVIAVEEARTGKSIRGNHGMHETHERRQRK